MSETDRYIETFKQEAEELLSEMEDIVLAIEDNPDDQDNVNRLFRAMHTIKGSGAMFGFDDIAAFTHHVETALDKVRSGVLGVSKELIDIVLASRDQISVMLDAASGGPQADPAVTAAIIAKLNALLNGPSSALSDEPNQAPCDKADTSSGLETFSISFCPDQGIFATGTDPGMLLGELSELGECTITANVDRVPSIDELDPEICYLSWNVTLTTDKGINSIQDVFIFVDDTCQIEIVPLQTRSKQDTDESHKKLGEILIQNGDITPKDVAEALSKQKPIGELLVDSGVASQDKVAAALAKQQTTSKSVEKNDTLRVASDKLDVLVNLIGELVINQAQLAQVSARLDDMELATTVEGIERLTNELRDTILNIRMMPIGVTFGKFKRLVRDMSTELGKEIEMVTDGAETELDKTVIDRLSDPLVHLIRNSIDHGIESPEQREQEGKNRKGTIRLSAAHVGTNVVVSIQDDGKGLNKDVIHKKAIEKGLISPDMELQEKDIFSLIFLPGFSTAGTVTNISGRGVGMDVVRREIEALRGSINITSTLGKGTTIDLNLPLTLAIIEGLLVEVDDERYVIPLAVVEECQELTENRLAMSHDRNVIQVRGELVPFVRLREVFRVSGGSPAQEEVVVVGSGDSCVGIVVDHVIGDHQTVIKSLGKAYRDVEGVSGATILGDGSVALILDVPRLVNLAVALEEKYAVSA